MSGADVLQRQGPLRAVAAAARGALTLAVAGPAAGDASDRPCAGAPPCAGPAAPPCAGPAAPEVPVAGAVGGPVAEAVGGPIDGSASGSPEDADLTARANTLALAHQAGEPDALPALVAALQPLLRTLLHRFLRGRTGLPSTLDLEDLHQQGWIILEGLARRWDPAGGAFPAYVRTAFPWELWRYVRGLSPTRRARAVRVDPAPHDLLMLRLADQTGADGRRWDEQLVAAEMLNALDPTARWVFALHVLEDRPFHDVARLLGLTVTGAHRAYRRALDQLRLGAGLELAPDDARAAQTGRAPAVERLVAVLHEATEQQRRLPGRAVVCARAGLSEVRFARLMSLLAQRGCIVGRSARRAGRLVYATPAETLAQLRRPQPLL